MKKNSFLQLNEAGINSASSFIPTFQLENSLLKNGMNLIAGIDEAGRGALAGPLSVGIVIFHRDFILNPPEDLHILIKDSKKLTEKRREKAYGYILENALSSAVGFASHRRIDKININRATEYAIKQALKKLTVTPEFLLLDGNFKFDTGFRYQSIKSGDNISFSIAAASIMAKVTRDRIISKYDNLYPEYDFAKNKGYGTMHHIESINRKGFSPAHRKSYEPVKSMISEQESLFNDED